MRLEDLLEEVDSRESFLAFVEALRDDCDEDERLQGASEWWGGEVGLESEGEAGDIPGFLDAMLVWGRGSGELPAEPSWRDFARLLLVSRSRD